MTSYADLTDQQAAVQLDRSVESLGPSWVRAWLADLAETR